MKKTTLETKIKDWYTLEYPHDTNGIKMNPDITFGKFSDSLWANDDVYESMGVECDTMRIRLFKEIALIRDVTFQRVEREWIFSDL